MIIIYKDACRLQGSSIFLNILHLKKYIMKFTNYLEFILEIGSKNKMNNASILNFLISTIIQNKI